jgi:hypothetical protein
MKVVFVFFPGNVTLHHENYKLDRIRPETPDVIVLQKKKATFAASFVIV